MRFLLSSWLDMICRCCYELLVGVFDGVIWMEPGSVDMVSKVHDVLKIIETLEDCIDSLKMMWEIFANDYVSLFLEVLCMWSMHLLLTSATETCG